MAARDAAGTAQWGAPVMTADAPRTQAALRAGTVSRLNLDAGFGYVRDADAPHAYIFLVGKALKHSTAASLKVGSRVRYRLGERDSVEVLEPAELHRSAIAAEGL